MNIIFQIFNIAISFVSPNRSTDFVFVTALVFCPFVLFTCTLILHIVHNESLFCMFEAAFITIEIIKSNFKIGSLHTNSKLIFNDNLFSPTIKREGFCIHIFNVITKKKKYRKGRSSVCLSVKGLPK